MVILGPTEDRTLVFLISLFSHLAMTDEATLPQSQANGFGEVGESGRTLIHRQGQSLIFLKVTGPPSRVCLPPPPH